MSVNPTRKTSDDLATFLGKLLELDDDQFFRLAELLWRFHLSASRSGPRAQQKKQWEGVLPEAFDAGVRKLWQEWLDYRRLELREVVTQRAGDATLKLLAKMGNERAKRAIQHSMAHQWRGIFEPKEDSVQTDAFGRRIIR